MSSGKECTVSLRDLAPCGETNNVNQPDVILQTDDMTLGDGGSDISRMQSTPNKQCDQTVNQPWFIPDNTLVSDSRTNSPSPVKISSPNTSVNNKAVDAPSEDPVLRRSGRERRPPERLIL